MLRLHRHRRERQGAHGGAVDRDIQRAEQDVADHGLFIGDQLDGGEARSTQVVDQPGLVRAAEGFVVEARDRLVIAGRALADHHCAGEVPSGSGALA